MKQNFRILSLSILTFLFVELHSQEKDKLKEYFVEAESYFLFEEYTEALPLYQRILREEPQNYNVTYKIGICYLNNPYQKHLAIQYLSQAAEHINKKYKKNVYKEKNAPAEVVFYLGQAYRVNDKIDKALECFLNFKQTLDPDIFDIETLNFEIEACERAKGVADNPVYFVENNLGKEINTRFAESNAVLSGNGKTLVFNRELQFYNAVFIVHKNEEGKWGAPYNLTPDFGLDGDSYCTGISYDGSEIFVYRSDDFDGNIYSSKQLNGQWQKLEKLNDNINTKYWESHASVSPDGKTLFFTSNRKGGYGGLDIYKSSKDATGKWDSPLNLGPVVNSPYNEDAPFISPDGQKLFFSSLGHNSIGGYDLFVSQRVGDGKWARPVNMGYPLNTPDDDNFFCPVTYGEASGITSNYDPKSTLGLKDIYWVEVYNDVIPRTFNLKGQVNVPQTDLLVSGSIVVSLIDNQAGKILEQISLDDLGDFEFKATQGKYQLLVDGENIKPVSVPINLKVAQKASNVALPLITLETLGRDEKKEPPVIIKPAKLELVDKDYIFTDTVPVKIDLKVMQGSSLAVELSASGKKLKHEEYFISKEDFSYIFNPKEGENKIIFKVKDSQGRTNQLETSVYYTPAKEDVSIPAIDSIPATFSELEVIADKNLQKYLSTLKLEDYSSLVDLYDMLLNVADQNEYTENEVEKLMQVLLTQRNKEEFLSESKEVDDLVFINDTLNETETFTYPLAIVKSFKTGIDSSEQVNVNIGLVNVIPFYGNNTELSSYILTFLSEPASITSSFNAQGNKEIYNSLNQKIGEKKAEEAIELSSTTENLGLFLNNLLISSGPELFAMLKGLDLDSLQIYNSIELVDYLFNEAKNYNISKKELIAEIEKAQRNKIINIDKFRETLAEAATGQLKIQLQNMGIEVNRIRQLNEVIEDLVKKSKSEGYSNAEVYELLINMLGYTTAKDFIAALQGYSNGMLNSALSEMKTEEYSLPIEVIQYLLTQAPYFDYTDSDINNLLIKMLLEQGLESWKLSQERTFSKEFIKKRRFITTIILVNIFIIVLIIVLARRNRKKD